eukprot:COSAG03_NODE_35940_length_114_cov_157.666667_1_plen_20_part_01
MQARSRSAPVLAEGGRQGQL